MADVKNNSRWPNGCRLVQNGRVIVSVEAKLISPASQTAWNRQARYARIAGGLTKRAAVVAGRTCVILGRPWQ